MPKVILTGANGFIGKNFRKVLEQTWEVIPVEFNDCWTFLKTFEDWDDVEFILHQGAISDTTETNIEKIHNYNVCFTISLFEIAKVKGIPVKYASSASVYGNHFPFYNPLNYYAISKLQVDYWVQDHIEEFSHIQGFRYFNVYGPHEEDKVERNQSSPISKFIQQAKEKGEITLFHMSERFCRDFVHVDDLINIVLDNEKPSGIYDLGTSQPISFQEVADLVAKCYNAEIKYIGFPPHLKGKYQDFTCAKQEWGTYEFKTVKDYVESSVVQRVL